VAVTQSGDWAFDLSSVEVTQDTAANLLCTASQGGTWNVGITGTAAVTQSGTWNVGTVSTVTAVTSITDPVAATQSGSWTVGISGTPAVSQSGTWTVGLSAAQTLATVTTVGTITNPVTVAQSTAANLKATVSIDSGQTVGIAAGTNLIGRASASAETGTVYNGTTALTPQFARFATSSSGKTTIVSAQGSGKKIRVLRWNASANGGVGVTLYSGTSTAISGVKYMTQYASAGGAFCPVGICETAANEALSIDLSAAVAVSGEVTYIVVG
jgi:hypothetical protein